MSLNFGINMNKTLVLSFLVLFAVLISVSFVSACSSDVDIDNANVELDNVVIGVPTDVDANARLDVDIRPDVNARPDLNVRLDTDSVVVFGNVDVRPPMGVVVFDNTDVRPPMEFVDF